MSHGIFVTGTDTGVGKTHFACALMRAFAAEGLGAIGMKPVAAGIAPGDAVNADVAALAQASNREAPLADRNPYGFAPAIAPHLAAAMQGTTIDLRAIANAYARLSMLADVVVVEGAGGVMVPLGLCSDMLDIPARVNLSVVLVVGMRLGCINHALLSAQAVRARGLRLAGWVANVLQERPDCLRENLRAIEQRLAAPRLALLEWNAPPVIAASKLRRWLVDR